MEVSVSQYFNLKDKAAIVTGGQAGLGYDIACVLAEAGCDIILTSRNAEKLENSVENIKSCFKTDALALQMDQRCYDQVEKMVDTARAWKGHIDICVNNAGGGSGSGEGHFLKRPHEDIVDMVMTNLVGVLFCSQLVGRVMAEQKHGKIINIASIAGIVGRDRETYRRTNKMEQPVDYAAAKAGVVGMTRDLAAFMAPYCVQVNCISPGGFDKGDLPEEFVNAYSNMTPMRRMGIIGSDIKGAALFLASSASDYVTGHNLVVDGGFSVCK